jgi:hypothetical protein
LLLDFDNLEFHVHGLVADLGNDVEEVLDWVDVVGLNLQLLLEALSNFLDLGELFLGDVSQNSSQTLEPLVDLLQCV